MVVEVLQEEKPGRLLGVVELAAAARLFPKDVIDVLEGLLKHVSVYLMGGLLRGQVYLSQLKGADREPASDVTRKPKTF